MAVITLTISQSPIEIVAGIPKTVSLSTNIVATIFYTVDGTEPTIDSDIYIEAIRLPTDKARAVLKAFATNGTDTSVVVTRTFYNTTFAQARQPHDKVINLSSQALPGPDLGPFGNYAPNINYQYGNMAGITVDDPTLTNIPDGYDGTATGTYANGTDLPLTDYKFVYSETNSIGERGPNIGTVPAFVKIYVPPAQPQQSNYNSKLFNPKALVIFQDGTQEPEEPNAPLLNRPFFFMSNTEKERDGTHFHNTALDGAIPTGSLLRQHYNPSDQTITYYYFDSNSLRWIISKEPFRPKTADVFALDQVVLPSSTNGSRHIYKWIPFKGSRIV
jgi:hypothetical protein